MEREYREDSAWLSGVEVAARGRLRVWRLCWQLQQASAAHHAQQLCLASRRKIRLKPSEFFADLSSVSKLLL
jgi:hypothetical protein